MYLYVCVRVILFYKYAAKLLHSRKNIYFCEIKKYRNLFMVASWAGSRGAGGGENK